MVGTIVASAADVVAVPTVAGWPGAGHASKVAKALPIDTANTTVSIGSSGRWDRPVDPATCLSGDAAKGSAWASHQGS
jgi:hypothetical protein